MSKILTILVALAKLFLTWDKEKSKQQGRDETVDRLKKDQDEKIKKAADATNGDLPDELLLESETTDKK